MSEHKEPIPSMIYNASIGGHVTNSQQIIDENENKEQSQINAEVKQNLGQGGSVDTRINQTKNNIIGGASSNGNTLKKLEDRVLPIESAVGTGGNIDTRIEAAVTTEKTRAEEKESILDNKITTEKTRAEEVEENLDRKIDTLETIVGQGDSINSRISDAVAKETTRAQNVESTLQINIDTEITRAQTAEEQLRTLYNNLQQSQPVPVTELPSIGEEGKIYRLAGTTSYSDYIWNGIQFIKMATYNNAIDDDPIIESENLVKSGGVFIAINTEKERAMAAEKKINDDLSAEITRAEDVEKVIQVNIDAIGVAIGKDDVEYINLVDTSVALNGTINSLGEITINESQANYVSDYIDVSSVNSVKFGYVLPDNTFKQISVQYVCFDENKTKTTNRLVGNTADVSDVSYIRILMASSAITTFVVTDVNSNISLYIPYGKTKQYGRKVEELKKGIEELKKGIEENKNEVSSLNTELDIAKGGLVYPINRFNLNDTNIVNNGTFNSAGTITTAESTTSFVSGFCFVGDIENFCIYSVAGNIITTYYCLYDENKNLIGGRRTSSNIELSSTEGATYVRIVINMSYKETCIVASSNDLISYEPYFEPYSDYSSKRLKDIEYDIEQLKKENIANEVTVGVGGDYTSILRALKETNNDVTIHILNGTYNIEQEYKDYYSDSFWDNYIRYTDESVKEDLFYRGLWLGKGRHVYGNSDVNIIFNYPDTGNSEVINFFSIFANDVDTILENVKIHVNHNVRYSIHDDFKPYDGTVIWRNIIFYGSPHSAAHIGAGLGFRTNYLLEGLVFTENNSTYDISYHGSATSNPTASACKIEVKNCYGTKSCAFRWYGPHTVVCPCIVHNSKFGNIECKDKEDNPNHIENMKLIQYCNEIGS